MNLVIRYFCLSVIYYAIIDAKKSLEKEEVSLKWYHFGLTVCLNGTMCWLYFVKDISTSLFFDLVLGVTCFGMMLINADLNMKFFDTKKIEVPNLEGKNLLEYPKMIIPLFKNKSSLFSCIPLLYSLLLGLTSVVVYTASQGDVTVVVMVLGILSSFMFLGILAISVAIIGISKDTFK